MVNRVEKDHELRTAKFLSLENSEKNKKKSLISFDMKETGRRVKLKWTFGFAKKRWWEQAAVRVEQNTSWRRHSNIRNQDSASHHTHFTALKHLSSLVQVLKESSVSKCDITQIDDLQVCSDEPRSISRGSADDWHVVINLLRFLPPPTFKYSWCMKHNCWVGPVSQSTENKYRFERRKEDSPWSSGHQLENEARIHLHRFVVIVRCYVRRFVE